VSAGPSQRYAALRGEPGIAALGALHHTSYGANFVAPPPGAQDRHHAVMGVPDVAVRSA